MCHVYGLRGVLMIVCMCYLTRHDYPSLVVGKNHGILLYIIIIILLNVRWAVYGRKNNVPPAVRWAVYGRKNSVPPAVRWAVYGRKNIMPPAVRWAVYGRKNSVPPAGRWAVYGLKNSVPPATLWSLCRSSCVQVHRRNLICLNLYQMRQFVIFKIEVLWRGET